MVLYFGITLLTLVLALSSQIFGFNLKTSKPTNTNTTVSPNHLRNITATNVTTKEVNGTKVDDRIGLVYQKASAYGTSDEGGESSSQQASFAVGAGIEGSDGSYSPIAGAAKTWGDTSAGGFNAPNTWAQTAANVDQGEATGSANAGVEGGEGTAETEGYASNARYPLGFGQTLYSNLNGTRHLNGSAQGHPVKNLLGNQTALSLRNSSNPEHKLDVLVLPSKIIKNKPSL